MMPPGKHISYSIIIWRDSLTLPFYLSALAGRPMPYGPPGVPGMPPPGFRPPGMPPGMPFPPPPPGFG